MIPPSPTRTVRRRAPISRSFPIRIRAAGIRWFLSGFIAVLSLACVTDGTAHHPIKEETVEPSRQDASCVALDREPTRATPVVFATWRQDMLAAVTRASSTVLALGRGGESANIGAARALAALAQAIRTMPDRNPAVAALLARIDRDAALLQTSDELDVGAPGWAADGVLASVDAIERIGVPAGLLLPWADETRAAGRAIDKEQMLAFQRPILQEAFRSAADALLVVAQRESHSDPSPALVRTAGPTVTR